MSTLPEDQRLIGISPKAYEHPADRAATAALHSIPMLDSVVRRLIEYGYERALRQQFLAASVKLGEDQLPATWADWNAVCARLDLPERYDLYLTQFPITNAAAIGAGTPMVMVNSRTLEVLDALEVRTVLGHEAGHILSDHVLYRTALIILISITGVGRMPVLAGLPLLGVKYALLEWFRAAELSCDRAATLVTRDPLATCRTMLVLAGGMSSRKLDLDAFMRQATEYEEWDSGWDRLNRLPAELGLTHSYPVRRVKEIMAWVRSGDYDRILAGEFTTRDQAADPRKEAGDAVDYYTERFRGFLKDAGAGMDKAGDRVAGAADRLQEWLRGQQPRDSS
jgi:Zn-dependent protease with chaperone function